MLTDIELSTLRRLRKTAILVLLMIRLDRPVTVKESARLLDLHPQTTRSYFKQLAAAGYVARSSAGYVLAGGNQLALPINNHIQLDKSDPVISSSRLEMMKSLFLSYGIDENRRTLRLMSQPWMTKEFFISQVNQLERQGKFLPQWTGLLIKFLEKGKHQSWCKCEYCDTQRKKLYKEKNISY